MMFDAGQELRVKATQAMLCKIERSIANNEFCLYYQPKIDCRKGRVVGVEALVRWRHPILGMLAPNEFLPLIEHDDLIVILGDWVLRDGLAQAAEWYLRGLDLKVSVNISARQLYRKDFVSKLKSMATGYPPEIIHNLEIEIVETAALEDVNTVSDAIRECRAMGVSVALDDFGTGFSSLVHLKRLKTDVLKIDQTFVRGMLTNPEDMAIVSAVIGLSGAFRQQVVAEGVETIDHILMLLDQGCDVMQGYAFARPMPAEKLPEWIDRKSVV
jgi:EAL domain-containing protein (putative c-di-GMP-specific phosphodiesterase class I)